VRTVPIEENTVPRLPTAVQPESNLRYPGWRVVGAAFFGVMVGYSVLTEVRHEIGISDYFAVSAGDKFFLLKGGI
jgi:hypothetical protein